MDFNYFRLSQEPTFTDIIQSVTDNKEQWENYMKNSEKDEFDIPNTLLKSNLTQIQKLLIFRCFQPTKLLITLHSFVERILDKKFTEFIPFDLPAIYTESTCLKPLLFILTSNYDPIRSVRELSEMYGMNKSRLITWSMGQRENNLIIHSIENGIKSGDWIILQNCHLASDWMPVLERICNNLTSDTTHPDFRLWLTSRATQTFPSLILRRSIKMINEPPSQLRGILLKTFKTFENSKWLKDAANPGLMKKLIFSLSYLHGAIIERQKYNIFGWNSPYDFGENDLLTGIYQIHGLLNKFLNISNDMLKFILAEDIYGGHLTDSYDSRCLTVLTNQFCTETAVMNDFPRYIPSENEDAETITSHIESMMERTDARVYGLHQNGNILNEKNETKFILDTVLWNEVNLIIIY